MSSVTCYEVRSRAYPGGTAGKIANFFKQESFVIDRFRKNRHKIWTCGLW
jgi:hypothetical protein